MKSEEKIKAYLEDLQNEVDDEDHTDYFIAETTTTMNALRWVLKNDEE
jgi:DNA-directed RNA polymerase subunit L